MKWVSWVIVGVTVLFGLITGYSQALAQPRVTAMAPSSISLPAGTSLTVTLQGRELDKIASAQVVLGASSAPGISAQLGPAAPASRTVTITAGVTAAPRSDYQLQLRQPVPAIAPVATIPVAVTVAIALNSLVVNPVAVTGGQAVNGTVSLTAPAAAGGALVTLKVDKPFVRVPPSVQVAPGQTAVTFGLLTAPVGASTPTVITAEYGRVAKTATVTVQPPAPASVAVSPQSVTGGTAVTGMVSLTGPAPTGGFVVPLASSLEAAAVPQSTTVAAGQTTATFQIATTPVPKNTPVTIFAGQGAAAKTATLTVNEPAVVSISGPATLTAFDFAFIKVTLDTPAPPNFRIMRSSSANVVSGWSGLSGTPDGQSTFTVPITGLSVSADTPVTLSATSGGVTRSATLTVVPYTISALTLSPPSVIGGGAVVGTITLSAPNRNSNPIVSLSSDNPAAAVANSVKLTLSETTKTFEILTEPVPSARTVTIRATMESKFGGSSRSATLTVAPAGISALSLSPQQLELPAGNPVVQGTVTLNAQAPLGGVTLALSSVDPSVATVSSPTLLIPAGQSSAQFNVTVNQSTTASSALIRATTQDGAGQTATIQLTRRPVPSVTSVTLGSQNALGGAPVTGTVTINQAFASSTPITFSASPSAYPGGVASATFQPSSVVIPAGQTTTTFTVTPAPVAQSTTLQISAFTGGQGRSAPLTVNPATLTSLTLPVSTVQGGFPVTGTVTFNAIKGPGSVTLSSSNTSAATVGGLSGGDNVTTGTFTITTLPVASPTPVTISAAFRGTTLTAPLTVVRPSILSAVTFPVQRIIGGVPVTATVALDGPAPDGGAIVSLAILPPSVFPGSVTIPAGQSSATVQFTTFPTNPVNPQTVSVLASYRGQDRKGSLTVEPLALSVPFPLSGQGGTQITVPVTIANNLTAPEGGLQLSLTSSNPAIATVPATLTFPAGESSASVVIATQPVATNTQVSITLSRPGQGSTFNVTLTP